MALAVSHAFVSAIADDAAAQAAGEVLPSHWNATHTLTGTLDTAQITDDAVTYAKIQDVTATDRILGRITSGSGVVEELTGANVRTITGLATGDSPQFAGVNIGDASDTTITRSSAGNIAVEGNVVYRVGGTDVALADGGTGTSLTDPNADRILFWDDSAGAVTWLTAGSGLTITDTTITASGSSDLVFADAPNTDFDVTNGGGGGDVTILSKSVTGITAKDQIIVEIWYSILNNSGTTRTYTYKHACGALEVTANEGAAIGASATNRSTRNVSVQFSVSATNLAFGQVSQKSNASAAADNSSAFNANISSHTWDSTTSDITGTQTVSFKLSSDSTTGTQTATLHSYTIRKVAQQT